MGQKVHPFGFRVGITKSHQSQWFARFHKHQYSQAVLEDRLLRQTLLKLLPEILDPLLKKSQKRSAVGNDKLLPKITHIKIERGYIPYEIGIQIHAGNVELLKSAVDYLKVNQAVLHNLQKTRCYLTNLRTKLKDLLKLKQQVLKKRPKNKLSLKQKTQQNLLSQNRFTLGVRAFPFGERQGRRGRQRRKNLRSRFKERFLNNILIVKKGLKITRLRIKVVKNQGGKSKNRGTSNFLLKKQTNLLPLVLRTFPVGERQGPRENAKHLNASNTNFGVTTILGSKTKNEALVINSQKTQKFVDTFVTKANENFIVALKAKMNEWQQYMEDHKEKQIKTYGKLRYAPLGFQKKWKLTRLNRLQKLPLVSLLKLVKTLQKKAFVKMENLRKEFVTFGALSQTESFSYYQIIFFIKCLKQLIQKLKTDKILPFPIGGRQGYNQQKKKSLLSLTEKALTRKLNNIDDECRKMKLIHYLTDVVKQHRQKNIYYYLATIADSHKSLQSLSDFAKQQCSFLFGMDFQNLNRVKTSRMGESQGSPGQRPGVTNYDKTARQNWKDQLKSHVKNSISEANRKNEMEKNLQDIFVQQIQKQRTMYQSNMQLTPKISLKFYSVKPQILETKASFIADCLVDDLEKRKAFRQVIKQAKENLMAQPKIKGVKIQVSGRLNGAEIARSEWVRAGQVPLQTLKANIDYCYKTASTIYGIIGVKVWIYKGQFKTRQSLNTVNISVLK
jgi:ribosomal protein S3